MAETAKLPLKHSAQPVEEHHTPRSWMPLNHVRHEFDRLFENLYANGWRGPLGHVMDNMSGQLSGFAVNPAFSFAEANKHYEITAELPGLDEKDIEIKLSQRTLVVKGEKRELEENKSRDYYFSERRYGSFMRSFELPDGIDTAKIEASFSKGILKISLPKSVEAQKNEKKIEIKAA